MPWVPISDAGIEIDFQPIGGASLDGSTVVTESDDAGFELYLGGPGESFRLRYTVLSYSSVDPFGGGVSSPSTIFLNGPAGQLEIPNEAGFDYPVSEFVPAQQEGEDRSGISYSNAHFSEWESIDSYQILIEVWVDGPEPPGECEEIGRASRAYVSAYDRSRVHVGRFRRQERRCVVANFNGAIPVSRSIASVTWRCTAPWVTKMSAPAIDGREATVTVDFQNPGIGALKATVTLDNGEIYNQAFQFEVRDSPWFHENLAVAAGPYSVTAEEG